MKSTPLQCPLSAAHTRLICYCLVAVLGTACQSAKTDKDAASLEMDSLLRKQYSDSVEAYSPPDEFLGLVTQQFGDLDSMVARRRIRVVVPYSLTWYYVDGTTRKGIAFDRVKLFEKDLNEKLHFDPPRVGILFIPVNRERVIPMVSQGYGDVGVAGFEPSSLGMDEVDHTDPTITNMRHIIVGGKNSPPLESLGDLADKEVYVRRGSDFESSLVHASDSLTGLGLKPIRIREVSPYSEIEDLLQMVDAGVIPYCVSYEVIANSWNKALENLVLYRKVALREHVELNWVLRKNSPQLKTRLNEFVAKTRHGTTQGNVLYEKYITNAARLKHLLSTDNQQQFFTLSNTFKKYGGEYSLDWILLAAQGYQESRLDQKAISPVGAVGIMQVMPFVAVSKQINIPNINITENNIHAGTKVMRYLIDTYFDNAGIDSLNQHLLALAAYNSGPTRMVRLRKETMARGLDPNVWFDNVETVVAHRVGREPINYVSNIYKYYASFKALTVYAEKKREQVIATK